MEDKLVSVIMPARNAAMTIGESINSVIAQTYGNWELVVVDTIPSKLWKHSVQKTSG